MKVKVFRCPECDENLLILPELKAMSQMVATHIENHRNNIVTMTPNDMVKLLKLESAITRLILKEVSQVAKK